MLDIMAAMVVTWLYTFCQNSSNCTPKFGCFTVCKLYLCKTDYKNSDGFTLYYTWITKRTLKQAFLGFKFEHLLHNTQNMGQVTIGNIQ